MRNTIPHAPETVRARTRAGLFAASAILVTIPFLAVTVPPAADLPQHLAQVRLLGEAMDPGSPYDVQWGTPYSLVYLLLGTAWAVAPPLLAGRLATAVLVVLWVGALHLLAWRLDRPPAAAVLGGMLAFSHVLYWGFLPFLLGFPVFTLWFLWLSAPAGERRPGREALGSAALAALLYLSHALWFAAGLAWLGLAGLLDLRRREEGVGTVLRRWLPRWAGGGAVALVAVYWFASISSTSFATRPLWVPPLQRRLAPQSWVEAAFGGLSGNVESVALAVLVGWLGLAVWRNRSALAMAADRRLALLGGVFLVAALVLPDKYVNTIEFNDRWMPLALALLLLAAPSPRLPRGLGRAAAVTLLAGFVFVTAYVWRQVERVELAGLVTSLEALQAADPQAPRVLGLDFLRDSYLLDREPFLQTFAWAQVIQGGTLNFSFADFPPSLVVYAPPRDNPWTPALEWYPQWVRRDDFGWFDHALVRGPAPVHQQFEATPFLEPLTPMAPWRLYRIAPDAPRSRFQMPAAPASESP